MPWGPKYNPGGVSSLGVSEIIRSHGAWSCSGAFGFDALGFSRRGSAIGRGARALGRSALPLPLQFCLQFPDPGLGGHAGLPLNRELISRWIVCHNCHRQAVAVGSCSGLGNCFLGRVPFGFRVWDLWFSIGGVLGTASYGSFYFGTLSAHQKSDKG